MALLLWALRLVRTGVFRWGGAAVRRWVGYGTRNRLAAFLAGVAATIAVQSSTATALMTASMAGQGFMTTPMALAVMLGADVGTSLVARLLAVDLHWLSPSLLLLGGALHALGGEHRGRRALARILVGIGLMLLALKLLGAATLPVRESALVQAMLEALGGEPLFALIVAAALTAAVHSSLATVMLAGSLAGAGVIGTETAVALVLGANLGGAVPAVLATSADGAMARRVPLGNLLVRVTGSLLALPLVPMAASFLAGMAPLTAVVSAHVAFNVALALLFLPLVTPLARLTEGLLPQPEDAGEDAATPRHLDESALETPSVAIAGAVRETLRLGDLVEDMLCRSLTALRQNDERPIAEVSRADDRVDRLHTALKLYLAKLGRQSSRCRGDTARRRPDGLRHQPGAHRRHHRQEPDGTRRQAHPPPSAFRAGGFPGGRGAAPPHGGEPAHGARHPDRRGPAAGPAAHCRQGRGAGAGAHRHRPPPRPRAPR
ncbi:Na/Pi cotransporter family protein [Azospirillum baldaniorum]|uniref:Na/Pi cotransporter family protein n=1 Tax=Azospirillum baldaniorum TaxID=1064539 RepID=UPI0002FC13C3|nr:Na/Pi cotransporter family protein [Azospirillum baldaniorum]